MTPEIASAGEDLLRAYLSLTAVICNRRMVSGMTFNETVVCNHLRHQQLHDPNTPLTATDLCEKTNILKSQMNQVISSLEKQGFISRTRSQKDRRQMDLSLTESGLAAYLSAHAQASELLGHLVEKLGLQFSTDLTRDLTQVVDTILNIQQKGIL